jgi:hypothetical protein
MVVKACPFPWSRVSPSGCRPPLWVLNYLPLLNSPNAAKSCLLCAIADLILLCAVHCQLYLASESIPIGTYSPFATIARSPAFPLRSQPM